MVVSGVQVPCYLYAKSRVCSSVMLDWAVKSTPSRVANLCNPRFIFWFTKKHSLAGNTKHVKTLHPLCLFENEYIILKLRYLRHFTLFI